MFILAVIPYIVAAVNAYSDTGTDLLPRFGRPLNNLTVSVGREAVFKCIVENLGMYKVAWLRVDTQTILTIATHVITKNHRITVVHTGHRMWSLHIKDTRETDRGWYMCQVNTDPMSSNTGFLEVVVPPDILNYPTSTDMEVMEGSNVTLRCAATGTPKPTVTWRRETNEKIVLPNWHNATTLEGPELALIRVTRHHMGPYLCIASNGVPPSVSKRIVLIVNFSPMIRIEKQLIGAYEGQTLTLECLSEAYPRPVVYWTRPNNETIVNDNNYKAEAITNGYETIISLLIKSVRPQDYGTFRCIATNLLGETDGRIELYKIPKPPSTRKPNSRRDPKKWNINRSHERNSPGIKDELMFKEEDDDNEENMSNSESSTSASGFRRYRYLNALTVVMLSTLLPKFST
ncbi:protein amalgam-like [Chelonus insularis]|uniref:protein amalgam-like n=1 Tax=Chelonus insularis TaxID=460826 RepID=UPI00158CCCAA|nr:protein amalgam-like [Chelonus insularis]